MRRLISGMIGCEELGTVRDPKQSADGFAIVRIAHLPAL